MNSGDSLTERSHRVQEMDSFLSEDVRDFAMGEGRKSRRTTPKKGWAKYIPRRKYLIWSGALIVVFIFVAVGLGELASWPTGPRGDAEQEKIFRYKHVLQDVSKDVLKSMDRSIAPCYDFYQYACGGWLNTTSVPSGRASVTRSIDSIKEKNSQLLRKIVEGQWPLVSTFYNNCMDEETISSLGEEPLASYLVRIASIQNLKKLFEVLGELHSHAIEALFSVRVAPEPTFHNLTVVQIGRGGLTLPRASDYSNSNTTSLFTTHVGRLFTLINKDNTYSPTGVHEIETRLAEGSASPDASYVVKTVRSLATQYPNIQWSDYFAGLGANIKEDDLVIVLSPSYLAALNSLLNEPMGIRWNSYLAYQLTRSTAELLQANIRIEVAQFRAQLNHEPLDMQPRWRECVTQTELYLGPLLAHHYIFNSFPESTSFAAKEVEKDIENALTDQPPSWLDKNSTVTAKQKLAAISEKKKFGYPAVWETYPDLWVESGKFFDVAMSARKLSVKASLKQLGKPVAHSTWETLPQAVDTYFRVDSNELVVPAGIMQPPFFNASYPSFMNYGGIGFEIARELVHAFDQQGRYFDETGARDDWWTNTTAIAFDNAARCLAKYYSQQSVPLASNEEMVVNGTVTLDENVADILGLNRAFAAYMANGDKIGDEFVKQYFDGLNSKQMLFVSFAQGACTKYNPEYLVTLFETNSNAYPPASVRVNGAVAQSREFAAAFGCPSGSPMNPKDKCKLW